MSCKRIVLNGLFSNDYKYRVATLSKFYALVISAMRRFTRKIEDVYGLVVLVNENKMYGNSYLTLRIIDSFSRI